MSADSQEENSSSEESFGWVNMGNKKLPHIKRVGDGNAEGMSSDSEDDSDDTEFEAEGNSEKAVNPAQDQQLGPKGNGSTTFQNAPAPTEDLSVEQDVSRNEISIDSAPASSLHEDEEEDSAEEQDHAIEDKKVLKRFTKKLIVKKERFSHTLSDDESVDSPSSRRSVRVKSESNRSAQENKHISKSDLLIKDVLIDSSQTLPFDIGANEDVWILQCPCEISESTLKGKTINFNGVSCIDQFESNVLITPEIQPVNLLLPKSPGKVVNIVPTGHIILKEKETTLQAIYPLRCEENIISLPAGLKVRHPLFGTELPLMAGPFVASQAKKKKKKKKHHDTSLVNEFTATENGVIAGENNTNFCNHLNLSPVHMKVKRKKKDADKHSHDITYQDTSNNNPNVPLSSFSTENSPKNNSQKYESNSYDDISYLSEMVHKKHRKFKCESEKSLLQDKKPIDVDKKILPIDSDGINSIYASKMKKISNEIVDGRSMTGSLTEETQDLVAETLKKKKKKKHKYEKEFETEYVKSTVKEAPDEIDEYSTSLLTQRLQESADNIVDSSSDPFKKKKKKKVKHDYSEISNYSSEIAEDDSFIPSHKKSKKVKLDRSVRLFEKTGSATMFMNTNKVENVVAASLHSFDHDIEKVSIKKRKKSEHTAHSLLSQSTGDNFPVNKNFTHMFNKSVVKQEPEYQDDTSLMEMQYKKKKKKKTSE